MKTYYAIRRGKENFFADNKKELTGLVAHLIGPMEPDQTLTVTKRLGKKEDEK